jgi:uncharacterized membrane protein
MTLPLSHAVRDASIIAVTLLVWWVDATLRNQGGTIAVTVAIVAGALTALCGYLLHEWGHLLGALSARSAVHLPETASSVFLFRFDSDRNSRAQFLRMSMGGFVASALVIVLLVGVLPLDALSGKVAMFLVVLGVVATFILEVPVAWRVARGAPIPSGAAYRSATDAQG